MSDEPHKPTPGAGQPEPSCIGVAPYYGPLPEPKKSNDSLLAQVINGMSDEPKKRSRAWIWWAAIALFSLAYPLSMGPVLRHCDPHSGLPMIYEPIMRLCELWQPVCDLKDWYTELWGVRYDRDPATRFRRRILYPD
ncbi:MAG TPA: hypothetical protein VGP76_00800 [Planctomycetaceae bacterium]|nr:hypothetical protein [Planctomycetaceae bacterium]